MRKLLSELKLELHPDKTRRVDLGWGKQGVDFLGCHLRKRMSGRIWEESRKRLFYLHRWPSQRAMKRIRQRVRELTPSGRCHADLREVIVELNSVVQGWGAYFRTGNATDRFQQVDWYVEQRLQGLLYKRKHRHLRRASARSGIARTSSPSDTNRCSGRSATRSPRMLRNERSPVSRVREIRTHGLKGGPVLSLMSFAPQG